MKYRVKSISQLSAVMAYKIMTSVVVPQAEAAHPACVSVVEPHACGPMAAARCAISRYAALHARGYTNHSAVRAMAGIRKPRMTMQGPSHLQLPLRRRSILLHLPHLSSQFPCLSHLVPKSSPPDNTVRIHMLLDEQPLAESTLMPRNSRLLKE